MSFFYVNGMDPDKIMRVACVAELFRAVPDDGKTRRRQEKWVSNVQRIVHDARYRARAYAYDIAAGGEYYADGACRTDRTLVARERSTRGAVTAMDWRAHFVLRAPPHEDDVTPPRWVPNEVWSRYHERALAPTAASVRDVRGAMIAQRASLRWAALRAAVNAGCVRELS